MYDTCVRFIEKNTAKNWRARTLFPFVLFANQSYYYTCIRCNDDERMNTSIATESNIKIFRKIFDRTYGFLFVLLDRIARYIIFFKAYSKHVCRAARDLITVYIGLTGAEWVYHKNPRL